MIVAYAVAVSSPHDRDEGGRERTGSFARPGPALRDQLRDYDPKYRCPPADKDGRCQARDLRFPPGRSWGVIACHGSARPRDKGLGGTELDGNHRSGPPPPHPGVVIVCPHSLGCSVGDGGVGRSAQTFLPSAVGLVPQDRLNLSTTNSPRPRRFVASRDGRRIRPGRDPAR